MAMKAVVLVTIVVGTGIDATWVAGDNRRPPLSIQRRTATQVGQGGLLASKVPATNVIRGRVVAATTGRPLVQAIVRIEGTPLATATDGQGRFAIPGVAQGSYRVIASKAGYSSTAYGQKRATDPATLVTVTGPSGVENIEIALLRGAVITVRVTDAFGDPISGYVVQALALRVQNAQRQLMVAAGSLVEVTDDRGEQRLFGLAEGDYYISARKGFARGAMSPLSQAPIYYPGTEVQEQAQSIRVQADGEVSVDLRVFNVKRSRVTGVVRDASGSIPTNASVTLGVQQFGASASIVARVAADGAFTAENVPPGRYTIQVISSGEYAAVPIQVSGEDVDGIVVSTRRPAVIRGRIAFDVGATPVGIVPPMIDIYPVATDPGLSLARGLVSVQDDWTFEMTGVMAWGRIGVRPPRSWYLKAILLNGADITDTAFDLGAGLSDGQIEVLLTQRVTRLSGSVIDGRGGRLSGRVVVVFADARERWLPGTRSIVVVRADENGLFEVTNLPADRYVVAVATGVVPGDEETPQALERLRKYGVQFTLSDGENKTLTVRDSR